MHEATLAQELLTIIEDVARKHDVQRVTTATIELGALSCVVPEALDFAFEVLRRNTVAEGCRLELKEAPLVVRCGACGYEGPSQRSISGCPQCSGVPVEVLSGREMRLLSIDVEDHDA